MKNIKNFFTKIFTLVSVLWCGIMNTSIATPEYANNPNIVLMDLPFGIVVIELYPQHAPNHVQRIKDLVHEKFYDGLAFHRVIENFMAQTGDPLGNGTGGSSKPNLKAEFNDLKHVRGVISMARSTNPDSANSQFFIMLGDAPHLDHQYTAFGRVITGMEFVDQIKKGDPNNNGTVEDPTKIIKMYMAGSTVGKQDEKTGRNKRKIVDSTAPA